MNIICYIHCYKSLISEKREKERKEAAGCEKRKRNLERKGLSDWKREEECYLFNWIRKEYQFYKYIYSFPLYYIIFCDVWTSYAKKIGHEGKQSVRKETCEYILLSLSLLNLSSFSNS